MNPTDATHDFVLAEAPPALALLLLVLLLLLLLLQPATASEPTAAATRTRRPFIGYASISEYLTMWVSPLSAPHFG
jgi:hypothetical protein